MCAFCGKIDSNYICDKCKKEIYEIARVHTDYYNSKFYEEHIYMFKYEDIRDKILAYKFDDKAYYFKTFARIFLNNKKICEILKSYDIIIPVPIHNKRRRERGYNQAELVAKEIAGEMGLEYINILKKCKNTIPQSTLSKEERIENSIGIYTVKEKLEYRVKNKKILIFDDVYTTGATANECAKVLKMLEPHKIGILTIAKD